jgi:two-component system NtrC family sensor kinase
VRLWLQLAIAMTGVAVLPLLVVATQAFDAAGSQAEAARKAARERECVAVADEIGRWIALKSQAVAGFAHLYPDLAHRPAEVQTGLLRTVYRAIPGVATAALLDDDGLVGDPAAPLAPVWLDAPLAVDAPLASRPRGSPERAAAFLEAIARPRAAGAVAWGPPFTPPEPLPGVEAGAAVAVAARSAFGDGALVAVDLSLDEVADLLAERAIDGRAWAVLTRAGDVVVAVGPAPDGAALRPLLAQPVGSLALAPEARVGAFAAVPGVPWAIVSTEPQRPDPAWISLRGRLIAAVLVAAALAWIVGAAVARWWARPVVTLRDAARAFADGELSRRVGSTRADELGDLARAFDGMASRLAATLDELVARQREIERANAELEERVAARTRALELAQAELVRAGQLAAVAEVGAGLAHDLNNPLAAVLGVLQVLQARIDEPATRALVARAEAEALRCREVAEVMQRLAEPGRAPDGSAPRADLGRALGDALALVRGPLAQRGITLDGGPPPDGVDVAGEPAEIRHAIAQVLESLAAGLPAGAALAIHVEDADPARVTVTPDAPVGRGETRDDFLAAGLGLWVARGVIAGRGGALLAPKGEEGPWVLVLARS